jgi:hypothetical protein
VLELLTDQVHNQCVQSQESSLAISFTETCNKLLGGQALSWPKFAEHKSGSVTLKIEAQRRLFAFLLSQPSEKVAEGNESLIPGLIEKWNGEGDPAVSTVADAEELLSGCWRLERIEACGFGGLTIFGGTVFDLQIGGSNWCLEGQNGSGKTSLSSAVLWALTGKRIREPDGPVDEDGVRSNVFDTDGKKIGDWPACAAYPDNPPDLVKPAEVWVRLTFHNADGDSATAYRRFVSPSGGVPQFEHSIDACLLSAPELIDIGLLMPARLARIGFGERSQTLYDAVKMITGLDRLADMADGCAQLTHGGRKFLKYGKDNGIDGLVGRFNDGMLKATEKAKALSFSLPKQDTLGEDGLVDALTEAALDASFQAGANLANLKTDIDPKIDPATLEGRTKIREAVGTARAVTNQATKGIPAFEAWVALKEASDDSDFEAMPEHVQATNAGLQTALSWHGGRLQT